jgi:hypothetical protein
MPEAGAAAQAKAARLNKKTAAGRGRPLADLRFGGGLPGAATQ